MDFVVHGGEQEHCKMLMELEYLNIYSFGMNLKRLKIMSRIMDDLQKKDEDFDTLLDLIYCTSKMIRLTKDTNSVDALLIELCNVLKYCIKALSTPNHKSKENRGKTLAINELSVEIERIAGERPIFKIQITQYLFSSLINLVVSEDLTYQDRVNISKMINFLLCGLPRPVRIDLMKMSTKLLSKLIRPLYNCGDYELQQSFTELMIRLSPKSIRSSVCKLWFPDNRLLGPLFCNIVGGYFEAECRPFLVLLNDSAGNAATVRSLPCERALFGKCEVYKPKMKIYDYLYVDFNLGSKSISMHFVLHPAAIDDENPLFKMSLLRNEVKDASLFSMADDKLMQLSVKTKECLTLKDPLLGARMPADVTCYNFVFRKSITRIPILLKEIYGDVIKIECGLNLDHSELPHHKETKMSSMMHKKQQLQRSSHLSSKQPAPVPLVAHNIAMKPVECCELPISQNSSRSLVLSEKTAAGNKQAPVSTLDSQESHTASTQNRLTASDSQSGSSSNGVVTKNQNSPVFKKYRCRNALKMLKSNADKTNDSRANDHKTSLNDSAASMLSDTQALSGKLPVMKQLNENKSKAPVSLKLPKKRKADCTTERYEAKQMKLNSSKPITPNANDKSMIESKENQLFIDLKPDATKITCKTRRSSKTYRSKLCDLPHNQYLELETRRTPVLTPSKRQLFNPKKTNILDTELFDWSHDDVTGALSVSAGAKSSIQSDKFVPDISQVFAEPMTEKNLFNKKSNTADDKNEHKNSIFNHWKDMESKPPAVKCYSGKKNRQAKENQGKNVSYSATKHQAEKKTSKVVCSVIKPKIAVSGKAAKKRQPTSLKPAVVLKKQANIPRKNCSQQKDFQEEPTLWSDLPDLIVEPGKVVKLDKSLPKSDYFDVSEPCPPLNLSDATKKAKRAADVDSECLSSDSDWVSKYLLKNGTPKKKKIAAKQKITSKPKNAAKNTRLSLSRNLKNKTNPDENLSANGLNKNVATNKIIPKKQSDVRGLPKGIAKKPEAYGIEKPLICKSFHQSEGNTMKIPPAVKNMQPKEKLTRSYVNDDPTLTSSHKIVDSSEKSFQIQPRRRAADDRSADIGEVETRSSKVKPCVTNLIQSDLNLQEAGRGLETASVPENDWDHKKSQAVKDVNTRVTEAVNGSDNAIVASHNEHYSCPQSTAGATHSDKNGQKRKTDCSGSKVKVNSRGNEVFQPLLDWPANASDETLLERLELLEKYKAALSRAIDEEEQDKKVLQDLHERHLQIACSVTETYALEYETFLKCINRMGKIDKLESESNQRLDAIQAKIVENEKYSREQMHEIKRKRSNKRT